MWNNRKDRLSKILPLRNSIFVFDSLLKWDHAAYAVFACSFSFFLIIYIYQTVFNVVSFSFKKPFQINMHVIKFKQYWNVYNK